MDNFILIDEQCNSIFFLHVKEDDNKLATYHLFHALENLGMLKNKSTIINIYELGNDDNIEMISLQHQERGQLEQFDLENINDLFMHQCSENRTLKTVIIEFNRETSSYESTEGNVTLNCFDSKKVGFIEYMGIKNIPSE